jgi:large conductance mechanosensitive channel
VGAWEDLKTFIQQGNVVNLAVAFVIGAAFAAVVTAFVTDLVTPIIGIAGHVNFATLTFAINGSTFYYGAFLNALIAFLVIAVVIFFAVVRPIAHLAERQKAKLPPAAVTTKECPFCASTIPLKATRCPNCTSTLP